MEQFITLSEIANQFNIVPETARNWLRKNGFKLNLGRLTMEEFNNAMKKRKERLLGLEGDRVMTSFFISRLQRVRIKKWTDLFGITLAKFLEKSINYYLLHLGARRRDITNGTQY